MSKGIYCVVTWFKWKPEAMRGQTKTFWKPFQLLKNKEPFNPNTLESVWCFFGLFLEKAKQHNMMQLPANKDKMYINMTHLCINPPIRGKLITIIITPSTGKQTPGQHTAFRFSILTLTPRQERLILKVFDLAQNQTPWRQVHTSTSHSLLPIFVIVNIKCQHPEWSHVNTLACNSHPC